MASQQPSFCTLNSVLKDEITVVGSELTPLNAASKMDNRLFRHILGPLIDQIGKESSSAQGLSKTITSSEKMCSSAHTLYLLKDSAANRGAGELIGILKIGQKALYLPDDNHKFEPLCVLDFYIKPNYQRKGYGKHLFDFMLKRENVEAHELAIDGPSAKMVSFLERNYNLKGLQRYPNNYAVSPEFFSSLKTHRPKSPVAPQSFGRFSANRRLSTIGSVIHGTGTSMFPAAQSAASTSKAPAESGTQDKSAPRSRLRLFIPSPAPSSPARSGNLLQVPAGSRSTISPPGSPGSPLEIQLKLSPTRDGMEFQLNLSSPSWPEPAADQSSSAATRADAEVVETALETASPPAAGAKTRRRKSQEERGHIDIKYHHTKLW